MGEFSKVLIMFLILSPEDERWYEVTQCKLKADADVFSIQKTRRIFCFNKNRKAGSNADDFRFAICQLLQLVVVGCYLIRMSAERMPMKYVKGVHCWFSQQSSILSSQKLGSCQSCCVSKEPHCQYFTVRNRSSQSDINTMKVAVERTCN